MKLGAYDYVAKPFDLDEVLFTLRRALRQRSLVEQVHALTADPLSDEPTRARTNSSAARRAWWRFQGRRSSRARGRDRSHSRRERHRQGTGCGRDPPQLATRRSSVREGELCRR